MNTYNTFCEAPHCQAAELYQVESFDAAVEHMRGLGWLMEERDAHGYLALCPEHRDGRTETMQWCARCGQWARRELNTCPTCCTRDNRYEHPAVPLAGANTARVAGRDG